jgi:hypothetical protein
MRLRLAGEFYYNQRICGVQFTPTVLSRELRIISMSYDRWSPNKVLDRCRVAAYIIPRSWH